jgi:MFS family permease
MNIIPERRTRLYTIIGVALAMFLGALDQTIVSTTLPRIVKQLSGLGRYTWVATIYLLISTILVPIYGKLGQATSASQFTRQIGSTVGAAVMGTVFSAALSAAFVVDRVVGGTDPAGSLASGTRKAFSDSIHEVWTLSILVMLAMLIITLFIPNIALRGRNDPIPHGADPRAELPGIATGRSAGPCAECG